ncbi:1-phosphofructokinase family hexose kinase [Pseudohoeflea coraliihabitans]|uniref:1-phosphofructokinase family hexose kinase n=1 Tax=Pseudohoeflea coraliihabitans TaxID=2860393 RepID=UPI0032049D6D
MTDILAIALNPTIDVSSDTGRIHPTRKVRTGRQRWHPGGGGVNVARVIAMLCERNPAQGAAKVRSELVFLCGGPTGALLKELLADVPVTLSPVMITEPTRLAFMVFEKDTGSEYRFVPEGPEASSAELEAAIDKVRERRAGYVVASGSLPRNAPADTYARMAQITQENGGRFILDANGAALRSTLEQSPVFLVKPSRGELEELSGGDLDDAGVEEAARQITREGKAEYVAVTLGRDGALLVSRQSVIRLPAQNVVVRSAVGAGDSFVGALVWFLSQGQSIEAAFRFGVAAGAAAARTPGTELCRADEVFKLYSEAGHKDDAGY